MKEQSIPSLIEQLSGRLVKNWPLYSFVTSNPLKGFEGRHFEEAVTAMREHIGIEGYPSAAIFEQVWNRDEIAPALIEEQLSQRDITLPAEASLERMKTLEARRSGERVLGDVDRQLIKWLTVFMDQGSTEWSMPGREEGLYKAWRAIAPRDRTLPDRERVKNLPVEALATLEELLGDFDTETRLQICKSHLLALPGWTGYIAYRAENENDWQQVSPASLTDYLAVRLSLCRLYNREFLPSDERAADTRSGEEDHIKAAWLKAMEQAYRERVFGQVASQNLDRLTANPQSPEAQLVFCIDTRSERIRRAAEHSGPYQTFGYAGFFGVAMDYRHPEKNITNKACPPIVESAFVATETTTPETTDRFERFTFYNNLRKALQQFRTTLTNNVPASFGYVESAGALYGTALLLKTLAPDLVHRFFERISAFIGQPERFSDPILTHKRTETNLSTAEKAEVAQAAFHAMGWDEFAPLVVITGHGSETANNPFGSSLDCGACAGNRGRHNARVMARICNDADVRALLAEKYDLAIPDETWFVAAEHNTTTNEIELFEEPVPARFMERLAALREDLNAARIYANREQFSMGTADPAQVDREAARRAADWAETRPEWGLAGNASFIIGPRELTSGLNLETRSFLHSYNWRKDPDGKHLSAILQGPMTVTQWINSHYYFSAVDNEHFGGGSKVTQNVTGRYGVVQGNGGDLRCGLPLESLREDDFTQQHLPLRLTVLVHAPRERVEAIIGDHPDSLGRLVENEWICLAVLDPQEEGSVFRIGRQQPMEESPEEAVAVF